MTRIEIFQQAFNGCRQIGAQVPENTLLQSAQVQMQYLMDLEQGKRHDTARLSDINIGLIAAREIEGIDKALADWIYERVCPAVEDMKREIIPDPSPVTNNTQPASQNELERIMEKAQAGQASIEDLMHALVRLPVFIPSRLPVEADGSNLAPIVMTRGNADYVAVYTSLERSAALAGQASYSLQLVGGDLLPRLPQNYGLVINAGFSLGFQIDAPSVQKIITDIIAPAKEKQASGLLETITLEDYIETIHFTPDGQTFASAYTRRNIAFWHVSDKHMEQQSSFPSGLKRLYDIALSHDAARLAAVGQAAPGQAQLCVWKVPSGEREQEYSFRDSYLLSTTFSPERLRLLAAGSWEKLRVVNLVTGQVEFAPTDEDDDDDESWGLGERNTSLVYHPDGKTVLITACSQGGSSVLFCELDLELESLTPREDLNVRLPADVLSPAAFSPDGRFFAFADWDMHLYRFPDQERVASFDWQGARRPGPLPDRGSAVVEKYWSNARFTPDSQTLVCGSPNGDIFLWDVPSGNLRKTLSGHDGGVLALAINPAGTRLVTSGHDKTLCLWQMPFSE